MFAFLPPPPLPPTFFPCSPRSITLALKRILPRASITQIKTMFRFWRTERSPSAPHPPFFSRFYDPRSENRGREGGREGGGEATRNSRIPRPARCNSSARRKWQIKRAKLPSEGSKKVCRTRAPNMNESGRVILDNYKVRSSTKFTRCVAAAN